MGAVWRPRGANERSRLFVRNPRNKRCQLAWVRIKVLNAFTRIYPKPELKKPVLKREFVPAGEGVRRFQHYLRPDWREVRRVVSLLLGYALDRRLPGGHPNFEHPSVASKGPAPGPVAATTSFLKRRPPSVDVPGSLVVIDRNQFDVTLTDKLDRCR